MQCKKGVYFSFDFGFPSILILSVKMGGGGEGGGGGGCLTDKIQNLLSMAKFICWQSLNIFTKCFIKLLETQQKYRNWKLS